MSYLNEPQIKQLLRGVNNARVSTIEGKPYMEAYDVRAHLTRIFGFARWSADVISMEQVFERFHKNSKGKDAVSVGYRAGLTLTVSAPDGELLATYTEYAAGAASGFPISKQANAHDMAIKTAESQALKRAAINLGDQFGLSLYQRGSRKPIVMRTLDAEETTEDVAKNVPSVVPEGEPEQTEDETAEKWEPSADWIKLMRSSGSDDAKETTYRQAVADGAPQAYLNELKEAGS